MAPRTRDSQADKKVSETELRHIEERSTPPTPIIYEIVRRHGDEEMERPAFSLWWSGVAAGLSISFSLLAQAVLVTHLPESRWQILISGFGYSVGFVMVVLSRQQLFTETTITAVLSVSAKFSWRSAIKLLRMWGIVFLANMTGTLFAALFCSFTPVLSADLLAGMLHISHGLLDLSWPQMFFGGISAGFLIAAMVWLLPGAESAQFYVIVLMTYLIAVGGFTHIVAGSVEAFLLAINGDWSVGTMLIQFTLPVLMGNIVGGTALFALLSYAQVMKEI